MAEESPPLCDIEKKLKKAAEEGNFSMIKGLLEQKSEEWKDVGLNIAVTGTAGVGKSSFINTVRGLTADDEGGAPVGVVDTTDKITPYPHPNHPSLIFSDLPGVGSVELPLKEYLKKVDFEQFDFFLIFSAGRFRQDDLLLAKEIRKLKKKFHFVRTKIDNDVQNHKKSHPQSYLNTNVVEIIRKDSWENLKNENFPELKIFLIDNHSPRDFDFSSLVDTVIEEMPVYKREAMILKMSLITEGVFEKKVKALSNRIYTVSLLSALTGTIPIPGVSAVADSGLLLNELNLYKSQLGLDNSHLERNARLMNTGVTELVEKLGLKSVAIATTAKCLVAAIACSAASEPVEKILPVAFPLVGVFLSAGLSYGVTVRSLKNLLKCCSDDARRLNEELFRIQ